MSASPQQRITLEDYFVLEETSATKHEFINGRIYAMTGASAQHNLIVSNLIAHLHTQLRKGSCRVFPSDMRLKIEQMNVYTYPDISIVCGALQFSGDRLDTIINPMILIEVLSPSTENYDRGQKFEYYRTIQSLQEYIVIAQNRSHIEHYIRQNDNRWLLIDFFRLEQMLHAASIGCKLELRDIYEYVEFDSEDL